MSRETPLILSGSDAPAVLRGASAQAGVAPGQGGNQAHGTRTTTDLPVLLAGPILRRSSPEEVMVWVAMSAACQVRAEVKDGGRVVGSAAANPVSIAQNLHLAWVAIRPTGGTFPTGRSLHYALTFIAPDGLEFDHGNGLVPASELSYGGAHLPSFILDAENVSFTHLVHASCRKLHGEGRDAALELNAWMRDRCDNTTTRPRMFLLTGDQIYADDVSGDLIRGIKALAEKILGFRETLPTLAEANQWVTARLDRDPPHAGDTLMSLGARRPLVVDSGGFTIDNTVGHSHLMGFGEFAAMYLLSWSPAAWDIPAIRALTTDARSRNYEDAKRLRRVMANVPCYMQLDDHEVTDDWPLDDTMVGNVEARPYGKWVIANALAGCWLFQLQGNGLGAMPALLPLQNYLGHAQIAASLRGSQETTRRGIEAARDSFRVSFVRAGYDLRNAQLGTMTPTTPPVILLDTRTQRDLSATGAPGLLTTAGRRWLRTQLGRYRGKPADMPVLIVSPAPVIGNPQFEGTSAYTARLDSAGGVSGRYYADREHWSMRVGVLREFLRTLAQAGRRIVIFSGDVHFGYTATATLTDRGASTALVQLNSSAIRNRATGERLTGLEQGAPLERDQDIDLFDGASLRYKFWNLQGVTGHVTRGQTLFTFNNFGGAKVDWRRGLEVVHKLQGEGQEGQRTVTL